MVAMNGWKTLTDMVVNQGGWGSGVQRGLYVSFFVFLLPLSSLAKSFVKEDPVQSRSANQVAERHTEITRNDAQQ